MERKINEDFIKSGVIKRIVNYTDGTSQVHLILDSGYFIEETIPFFGFVSREYLGRQVDIKERYDDRNNLFQIMNGSDFELSTISTKIYRDSIRERRREKIGEFVLT